MLKFYRTARYSPTRYSPKIEPINVVSATEKTILVAGPNGKDYYRAHRVSDYHHYHETFAEAQAFLVKRQTDKIANLTARLAEAERDLQIIKTTTPTEADV